MDGAATGGRAGGGDRPAGGRAGGCAANGTAAAAARAGLGDYDPQFGGCGSDVVEDNSGCDGYTCDVSPSTNANVDFHHKWESSPNCDCGVDDQGLREEGEHERVWCHCARSSDHPLRSGGHNEMTDESFRPSFGRGAKSVH